MASAKPSIKSIVKNENKENREKKSILYVLSILTRKVTIPYNYIGSNLKELIQKTLARELEGKCTIEGYVRRNSVRIVSYSSGILRAGNVVFDVVIECLVCTPVEGMRLNVRVKNITKAGIRCESQGEESPVDVFIARDHHYNLKEFGNINVDDTISVKVLGQRYELNDPKISVIAELIRTKPSKKKLVIKDNK